MTETEIFPAILAPDPHVVYALRDKGVALHDDVCNGKGVFGYEPEEIAAAVQAIATAMRQ